MVVVWLVVTGGLSPPQAESRPVPASTQAVRPRRTNLRWAIMVVSSGRGDYWPLDCVVVVVVVEVAGGGEGGMVVVVWLSLATAPVLSW